MTKNKKVKATTVEKTIHAISQSYIHSQHSIVRQLMLETPNHHLTTGTTRERVWLNLFESMIPKKFCIDQGVFIIDSYGNISAEVDLAIFDDSYTPYIFKFENIKFIPIEAVAVAVQCKSKNVKGVQQWAKSIQKLKTSYNSVFRIINGIVNNESSFEREANSNQGLEARNADIKDKNKKIKDDSLSKPLETKKNKFQTSTRPILVLCTAVEKASISSATKEYFDIVLSVAPGNTLEKTILREEEDYNWWHRQLNHYDHARYEKKERDIMDSLIPEVSYIQKNLKMLEVNSGENEENVLLSLTFQLNQLLMLINNPMAFPHQAYAEMFQKNYTKFAALAVEETQSKETSK